MAISKGSWVVNTIQSLANQVTGQATSVKIAFDKVGNDIKTYINNTLTVEIDTLDAQNVKLTGNQTVEGIKTFTSSPVVPTPTTDMQAGTKKYSDDLNTAQTGALTIHKSSTDHDGRYYTETELDAGQLDNRYFTETEINAGFSTKSETVKMTGDETVAGIKTFTSSPVVPTPTTDMQASTKKYVDDNIGAVVLGQIPDDTLTNAKLGTDIKVGSLAALTTTDKTSVVAAINENVSTVSMHSADSVTDGDGVHGLKIVNWATWTPTLTWTTGTPTGSIVVTARYTVIGKVVYFTFRYYATDSNGASNLTITLPVTPAIVNAFIPLQAYQLNSSSWVDTVKAYIDSSSSLIQFLSFSTVADGNAISVAVSGFYEIA